VKFVKNAVEVRNVSMRFNLARERVDNLKEYIVRVLKGQAIAVDEFWALRDVSFNVQQGESFALIGANGSGKSTMLKIISGILTPTTGSVQVQGNIAPLIELGAGFDMELTGRENIFMNGAILGFSKREMQEKYAEIVDFSELGEFIEVPVKNYSSGMIARLGFSCATTVRPEILIVDEILGVGDHRFQEKCSKRMEDMMSSGTTVILVSHSEADVERICKKAAWLDKGHLMFVGDTQAGIAQYNARG
jgi:ABC-type polysaccharide/polyol phosphate transport system ATPase subunit